MADFLLFKKAVKLIENKDHLTIDGLNQTPGGRDNASARGIVNLKASMNQGLSDMLKSEFPNNIPVIRPIIEESENLDPWWIVGFIIAEGCFDVHIGKSASHSLGYKVQLRLRISQHVRDLRIIESLLKTLNCGSPGAGLAHTWGQGWLAAPGLYKYPSPEGGCPHRGRPLGD